MEVNELQEDFLESYRARSSFWVPDITQVDENREVKWKLGPVFSERIHEGWDSEFNAYISEASGICVATKVSGPTVGLQGIAKKRMQIPSDETRVTERRDSSSRTDHEIKLLTQLTARKSTCTPKLFYTSKSTQLDSDPVPGAFIKFIIMEKLPGRNLSNFGELPMSERNQVRLAFARTIREFYALGYDHEDKANRNVISDRENKKCYIIDLEDAVETSKPKSFIPELDFYDWEIAGPQPGTWSCGLDPMVPHHRQMIKDPDDSVLEKWAAESAGKELLFLDYNFLRKIIASSTES